MNLSLMSVKRPVAITMLFLVIMLLGVVSVSKLSIDLLPELDLPIAMAMTGYEGAGPEEIENLLTRPIEGAVGRVNGIKTIHSMSSRGNSVVYVEFNWGTDMNFAINQMREKIDLIAPYLPESVEKTTLFKMDPNLMPIMVLGFGGEVELSELNRLATDVIQPNLERVDGVATVNTTGGVTREIRISAAPQKLQAYGLSLNQIISLLRTENRNTSAGTIEEGLKEHMVRVTGEFASVQEIEDLQVPLPSGGYLRLADIAKVEDTFKDKKEFVFMDGKPSVQLVIQRQTDINAVKVSNAILEQLKEIEKLLPQETHIKVGFDQAEFIRQSIANVTRNAVVGALLAMLVLLLFLKNLRSTLIIGTAIPISIVAAFILMYFAGLTLNLITLGGLALGVGMMVDNAIVILENIYRHRQEGFSKNEASVRGAEEVAVAIIASTLTTVVVFLPIVYVEGLASQIFRPMALTVTFSLLASLFVALTLVPMLASKILKVDQKNGNGESAGEGKKNLLRKLSKKWDGFLNSIDDVYNRLLGYAVYNRKKVIVGTGLLLIGSLALIPLVGMEFIPKQDTGEYTVSINLPQGTVVSETLRVTEMVEGYIQELPEHEWSFYSVGSSGNVFGTGSSSDVASIRGKLKPKDQRKRNIDQILDELRTKAAGIAGAEIEIQASSGSMGTGSNPIEIELTGDNLDVLQDLANTIVGRIEEVEGAREVKTSTEEGRPELHLKLRREKADLYGLNITQLSSYLATAINGSTATKYRENGEEINVVVVLEKQYRDNLANLEGLTITSPSGALVPLGDVAEFEITKGPTQIVRKNQTRQISVIGDISGRDLNSVTKDIQNIIKDVPIPPGVQLEFGGANKEMVESFQDLGLALILAIILVFMILAAQYESLLYPFVIMFAMPPTIVGVILMLAITGRTLNVATFIGIIMLAGIVVNNAIVLVDYINTLRRRDGLSRIDAIMKAGPTRLRPILMTTLTTILGMVPLLIGVGEGAEMSAPMATAVFGGLTFSTLITLLLVPCMYIVAENFGERLKRKIRNKKREDSQELAPAGGEIDG